MNITKTVSEKNFTVTVQTDFDTNEAANKFLKYVMKYNAVTISDDITISRDAETLNYLGEEINLSDINAIYEYKEKVFVLKGTVPRFVTANGNIIFIMKKMAEQIPELEQIGLRCYVRPARVRGFHTLINPSNDLFFDIFVSVDDVLLKAGEKIYFDDAKERCEELNNKYNIK